MCISVVFLQIISGDTAEKLVSRSVQLGACTCIQYQGEVLYIFGKSLNSYSGYGSFYIHKSVIATLIWCLFMHAIYHVTIAKVSGIPKRHLPCLWQK